MTFKKIFIQFTIFTLLLAALTLMATLSVKLLRPFNLWPLLLLFMYGLNLAAVYYLFKSTADRPAKFVHVFMLTSFGKMLLYIAIMLVYVYLNPTQAIPFVVIFLLYFMSFLLFEVTLLLKMNRNIQK